MIGRTNSGSGGLSLNSAVIHVTAPVGSTISFAKGSVTVATLAAGKGHTNASDTTLADWYYSISSGNYGSWTVTAAKDGESASETVTVDNAKQYDVSLSYALYLIRNGFFLGGYGFPNTLRQNYMPTVTENALNGFLSVSHTSGNTGAVTDAIDVTDYTTMYVEGYRDAGDNSCVGIWPSYGYATFANASSDKLAGCVLGTASAVQSLDISNIQGEKYVGPLISQGNNNIIYIKNLWLT